MNELLKIFIGLAAMIVSLSVHEYCHGLAAYLMGDETAKRMGRLTLNPAAHVDPIGTLLIPFLGALSGFPLLGWAKPVPYNPYNLKYRKWGSTIVAFAGPLSNFAGALIYLFALKFCIVALHLAYANLLVIFLTTLVAINVVLGVFNFFPIPPLDGSNMISVFLGSPKYRKLNYFLQTRGQTVLFILILLDFASPLHLLSFLFGAAINFTFSLAGL